MIMTANSSAGDSAQQRAEHQPVRLACTLTRGAGSPITAETIDLGTTGMRLQTERPLAVDEMVAFDLPVGEQDEHVRGQARVVGQERPGVYSLRFDRLTPPMTRCLRAVLAQT